jgi:hypothetical protein
MVHNQQKEAGPVLVSGNSVRYESFISPVLLKRDAIYELTYLKYLLTYLLTPWSRALLEKLTGFQLLKKFHAFYGTRRFITAFTSARHLSLSLAKSIQSIPPHPTS